MTTILLYQHTGIDCLAFIARQDMDVRVHDNLAGGLAAIGHKIKSIRLKFF